MKTSFVPFAFAALALVGCQASMNSGTRSKTSHSTAQAAGHHPRAPADALAQAKLEKLKAMQGEWSFTGSSEMPEGGTVRYTTVSAGSAVMEELFPGTPHSMVTMYHLENGRLALTHYCAMGNQPHMVAANGGTADKLRFECSGNTSVKCPTEAHMHAAEIDFHPDGKVQARWSSLADGKPDHGAVFDLQRKS
jgi:hypothetical protein